LNKFNNAISLYKTSLIYNNKIPEVFYSLAMANQSLGNFKESELYAYKTLELDKRFTKADLLISRSKKYFLNDNHLKSMIEKNKIERIKSESKNRFIFCLSKSV
jgi:tetratricopeptide (TPR) repeat protein